MKAIRIKSEDVFNYGVRMWFEVFELYIDDELVCKSSDIQDLIDESGIDINQCVVKDNYTEKLLTKK